MRIWVSFMAIVVAITLQGCGKGADLTAEQNKATVVQLAEVKTTSSDRVFTFPAKVVPKSTVNLAFRVQGRIQRLHLPEGQTVKKGALLAMLDPEPFKRAVSMAEVRLKQAELELKRVQAVATKGIGSEKSVDNAQVAFELAELSLENAKSNQQYSQLRAPFDALVAKRLVENQAFVKVGTAVAHLQDFSRIHFDFDVPERLINAYRRNDMHAASAYIGGNIKQSFPIYYIEHSTEPDPVTQTYRVVFAMDFPEGIAITPGVRATVSLTGSSSDGVVTVMGVPINAVVAGSDEGLYVWLLDEKTQTVHKQAVTVGPMSQGWVAILSGLEPGQKVVAAGASQMQSGLLVSPYVAQ
ncbi:MAG: efflux RND transporter periplasmic adaptor subunit [Bermanella sp.]